MEAMNWKFWRWGRARQNQEIVDQLTVACDWELKMLGRGFRNWFIEPPPHGITLEIMRREWATVHVIDRDKVRPEMNIYGLWWKLADGPIIPGTTILDLSLMAPHGSA